MPSTDEKDKSTVLFNLDAEQGLLGAVLFNNQLVDRIPALTGAEFYDPVHQALFAACIDRIRSGRLADAVSMREWAKSDAGMIEMGGAAYLLALQENAARLTSSAIEYGCIVRDMSVRRQLLAAAQEAVSLAQGAPCELDPADLFGLIEKQFRDVSLPPPPHVAMLGDVVAKRAQTYDAAGSAGLSTGIPELDKRFGGFGKSDLILFAGRPSMGKSALLANTALSMGKSGLKGHFASAEMSEQQVADRALSAASYNEYNVAFQYRDMRAREELRRPQKDFVLGLAAAYGSYPICYDFSPTQTVAHIGREARRTSKRLGGLDFVAVDHTHRLKSEGNERGAVERYDAIAEGLKSLARELRVPVIAAAQLNRGSEHEEDKRPTLANLRNSGAFEMEADVVVLVHRESYYLARKEPQRPAFESLEDFQDAYRKWEIRMRTAQSKLELHTAKQRQGEPGIDVVEFNEGYDVIRSFKGETA